MRTTISYAKVYESPEYAKDIEQDHMLEQNKTVTDGDADREQLIQGAYCLRKCNTVIRINRAG